MDFKQEYSDSTFSFKAINLYTWRLILLILKFKNEDQETETKMTKGSTWNLIKP